MKRFLSFLLAGAMTLSLLVLPAGARTWSASPM